MCGGMEDLDMLTLHGKGVSGGVAIGKARLLRERTIRATRGTVEDAAAEWARFEKALDKTVEELERLYEWSRERVGQKDAQIFSVHAMIAQDEDLVSIVRHEIHSKNNAEYAVSQAADAMAATFLAMEDAYMRERATDVRDVAQSLKRNRENCLKWICPIGMPIWMRRFLCLKRRLSRPVMI